MTVEIDRHPQTISIGKELREIKERLKIVKRSGTKEIPLHRKDADKLIRVRDRSITVYPTFTSESPLRVDEKDLEQMVREAWGKQRAS